MKSIKFKDGTKFVTSDGREFKTFEGANHHQQSLLIKVMKWSVKAPWGPTVPVTQYY